MTTTNATRSKIATLSFSGYKAKQQCYDAISAAYSNADKAQADKALLEAYADAYRVPKGDRVENAETGDFTGFAGTRRSSAPKSERMSAIANACRMQFARDIQGAFDGRKKTEGNKTSSYARVVAALVKLGSVELIDKAAARAKQQLKSQK